jgi:gamma-glutamylputrescine oxidase
MNISFWEKNHTAKADIIVLGNGIVGLQCALRLKQKYPKRMIWVLDRAPFSGGASMRNAGFACFGSMGEILDDIKRTSEAEALQLYANRFQGLKLLLEDFGQIETGYEKTGGYEIFLPEKSDELEAIKSKLDHINSALRPITTENPFVVKSTASLGMRVLGEAVFTPVEGGLQTNLLYHRIYQAALAAGVEVYAGVNVLSVEASGAGKWTLKTAENYDFECRRVVVCTNGFTKKLLPELDIEPARGQVLVTSHIPGLQWRGIMHADKGYIYFRSLGTRILIGGARNMDFEGENTAEIQVNERIQNELIRFLQEVVVPGNVFEVTHSWAGIMGMAENRTPIVQEIQPGCFVCARMGGMGVALSALVSRQMAALVTGL